MTNLPDWPPKTLQEQDINTLITQNARDYALGHGIVYRSLPSTPSGIPPQDTTIHAPMTTVPSPFPRHLFEKAVDLMPLFSLLYARVAMDEEFLERVMSTSVIKPMHLGLFRSDYLMHVNGANELSLQQVEFNTISSSFGALCTKVSEMHRYLLRIGAYATGHDLLRSENMPVNQALDTLADGLGDAHRYYISHNQRSGRTVQPAILFVIQPNERNTFDQRAIEQTLFEKHGIPVVRASLEDLSSMATLHGGDRVLALQSTLSLTPVEISVVYFRSGYGPNDYTNEQAWDARLLLERSLAIKCPTIALQLAGCKKVQQVLAEPGVLEHFVGSNAHTLRLTFSQLWPMDESDLGKQAQTLALTHPEKYVLKPQREGGSNNIYKEDIPIALLDMESRDKERASRGEDVSVKEKEGFILMSLIDTPKDRGAMMLRAGQGDVAQYVAQTTSELGTYGTALFGKDVEPDIRSGGYLLRTKASESNEGGVAVGFSVIDTPLLV
ncbi:glutathione synthase [Malassezia equina]|uniref:Glutathione synthetase n=1 Tax=Malassezia equina TaxID=1381935 RepID=A0AAF0EKL9_9BASI|nr:glutathione synthase [Malassezia equina]